MGEPADTESLISELERVGDAATKSPWKVSDPGYGISRVVGPPQSQVNGNFWFYDAEFITTARNRWDAILTALRENIALRAVVQEWSDKQGHDRCHWYPELLQRLADVLGVTPTVPPELPSRREFEAGCERFANEQYGSPCENCGGYYVRPGDSCPQCGGGPRIG